MGSARKGADDVVAGGGDPGVRGAVVGKGRRGVPIRRRGDTHDGAIEGRGLGTFVPGLRCAARA